MPKMYRRFKVERTLYRKMAFGTMSWDPSTMAAATPSINSTKRDSSGRHFLQGWDLTTGKATLSTGGGTDAVRARVPQVFTGQNTPSAE